MHHYSLRVQASVSSSGHPDRWRDWACAGRSVRASATRPASCPATPAVVVAGRVHARWWHLRTRIARRTLRRRLGRLSRCRRRYLRRFDRHHVSRSFSSRSDNGDDRARGSRAIRKWNRQPAMPARGKRLRCCGRRDRARTRRNSSDGNARGFRARRCRVRRRPWPPCRRRRPWRGPLPRSRHAAACPIRLRRRSRNPAFRWRRNLRRDRGRVCSCVTSITRV